MRYVEAGRGTHRCPAVVHGVVEYLERYAPFAEYLTDRGFVVFGHDHIGHGRSVRHSEDWGVMNCDNPNDVMVDDIYLHYRIMNRRYHGKPFIILGHSMGSYMLRQMLSQKGNTLFGLDGAIIMGTGQESPEMIDFGLSILYFLAAFRGWRYKSPLVPKLLFKPPYRKYPIGATYGKNSWLTRDQNIVHEYYRDPKCSFILSLGGFKGLFQACRYATNPENVRKIPRHIPVLFVSGDQDPVGDMGEGVRAAYQQFVDAGIRNVQLKLFEGDRHEILNELDREDVYKFLYDWMMECVARERSFLHYYR
ncbi:MAG: alpha/beta fold hydrolase [Lachnospiraceae bacterium]|nr:alpha/beta fold hydrolase [Lachnospiraceae bacterium]